MNVDEIRIRMYNTGSVGDCFLLLFQKEGTTTFSMLIDCGGFMTKKDQIEKCVIDIKNNLVNNAIDVVVVTHEHLDHVSGFNQARNTFNTIDFKEVWMSWTENENDQLAKKLLKEKGKRINALRNIISSNIDGITRNARSENRFVGYKRGLRMRKAFYTAALAVLDFEDRESRMSPGVKYKIGDAIQYVKDKCILKPKSEIYKKPGQVINNLIGAEGIKFHILGPPYHTDLHGIKNDMQENDMYSIANRLGMKVNNFNANSYTSQSDLDEQLISPFHKRYSMNDSEERRFFKDCYNHKNFKWRGIEYDWLDEANELAIALTDYVNNTSLAIAIEIESSGKVLLFPADAQSGNWISWHDKEVTKELVKNGGKAAKKLLEKTIFYKVGHHCSHNGTASISGLEMMKEKKVIAFIPLVQDKIPDVWGGAKNFPAKALYRKIIELTNGAVVRTDIGLINDGNSSILLKKRYSTYEIQQLKKSKKKNLFQECIIRVT